MLQHTWPIIFKCIKVEKQGKGVQQRKTDFKEIEEIRQLNQCGTALALGKRTLVKKLMTSK
jgi:hypothetical protein